MNSLLRASLVLFLWATCAPAAVAAEPVPITTVVVADGITMLSGRGGNVAVSNGADGVFVVDDQYAEQYTPILEAIRKITAAPVRFLLNTHWHNDHTGSNEKMGQAGAIIVAHENVRSRLESDQMVEFFKTAVPASAHAALPVITFTRDITLHLNGNDVAIFHVANAHTDGDTVVHFKQANVIHAGDVFFNGLYPFIDAGSGGSIKGVLAAVDQILARSNDDTRIIPGHGPVADRDDLIAYREMLSSVYDAVATAMVAGNSLAQIVAARPTAVFDATWGNGFLNPDTFVTLVHDAITRATLN